MYVLYSIPYFGVGVLGDRGPQSMNTKTLSLLILHVQYDISNSPKVLI